MNAGELFASGSISVYIGSLTTITVVFVEDILRIACGVATSEESTCRLVMTLQDMSCARRKSGHIFCNSSNILNAGI